MGVLDLVQRTQAAPASPAQASGRPSFARGSQAAQGDRPQAMVWLNIGYTNAEGRFVNLPIGLPIDTMETIEPKGQNEEWNGFVEDRNDFLNFLKELGGQLEPGQEICINDMEIRLRRRNDKAAVKANRTKEDLTKRFGFTAPPAPVSFNQE